MSTYAAPDAVGMGPPPGMGAPPGMGPPGMGGPPAPGDPGSMAMLAAALGAGAGGPTGGDGLPPELTDPGAGAPTPGGPPGSGDANTDLLTGMNSTDHIRAAIKHLMMAMTESGDDEESHGITKGMSVLHSLLAGKAKNAKTIAAAGG